MKYIYTLFLLLSFPLTSLGQSLSLSDFDFENMLDCDPNLVVCQIERATVKSIVENLITQILLAQLSGESQDDEFATTEPIVASGHSGDYGVATDFYDPQRGESIGFWIRSGKIQYDEDDIDKVHLEILRVIQELFTSEEISLLSRIIVRNDIDDEFAGKIYQRIRIDDGVRESWELTINFAHVSLESEGDYNDFIGVLAHELVHLRSLSSIQARINAMEKTCSTIYFYSTLSCARDNSYYLLFKDFWSEEFIQLSLDLDDALRRSITHDDAEEIRGELEKRYQENTSNFVSEYAGTTIHEDLAETITFYLMNDDIEYNGSLASKKIRSLQNSDELSDLKQKVKEFLY